MSFDTARRDIEKRLDANWATTRVAYENIRFDTPRTDEPWVQCRIFEDTSNRINVGQPGCHRTSGLIVLSVYVPKNTGTNLARDYASQLAEIFRGRQFNGITCWEATPTNHGIARPPLAQEGTSWYQFDVAIRFFWDGYYAT